MIGFLPTAWMEQGTDLAYRAATGDTGAATAIAQHEQVARQQAAVLDRGGPMSVEAFATVANTLVNVAGQAWGGYQQYEGMKQREDELDFKRDQLQAQLRLAQPAVPQPVQYVQAPGPQPNPQPQASGWPWWAKALAVGTGLATLGGVAYVAFKE